MHGARGVTVRSFVWRDSDSGWDPDRVGRWLGTGPPLVCLFVSAGALVADSLRALWRRGSERVSRSERRKSGAGCKASGDGDGPRVPARTVPQDELEAITAKCDAAEDRCAAAEAAVLALTVRKTPLRPAVTPALRCSSAARWCGRKRMRQRSRPTPSRRWKFGWRCGGRVQMRRCRRCRRRSRPRGWAARPSTKCPSWWTCWSQTCRRTRCVAHEPRGAG